ncbi:MAG: response regulator [Myxococcaceae bacterium]|nr:response regulator [Myxococcaceae bacterium]
MAPPKTINVLIVDDDRATQRMLADALTKQGFTVTVERDGEWAIKTFEKKPFDAVLLDLLLPALNGYEVARQMRSLPKGKRTPIIMISGVYKNALHQREAVQKHGAFAFLEKPMRLQALYDTLKQALGEKYPKPKAAEPPPPPVDDDDDEKTGEYLADTSAREEKTQVELQAQKEESSAGSYQVIRGDFAQKPFAEVLAEIYRWRGSGALLLRRDTVKKIVFFRDGTPISIKSNRLSECLGRVMVAQKMISEAECEESLTRMKTSKRQQGTTLIEMGCISPHNLQHALVLQLQAKLFDVFTWEAGDYQFNPKADLPAEPVDLGMTCAQVIYEGVKRFFDEPRLKKALGDVDGKYVHPSSQPLYALQDAGLGDEEKSLLGAAEGHRTVATLRAMALLSPLETDRFIFAMKCAQMIELKDKAAEGKAQANIAELARAMSSQSAKPPPLPPLPSLPPPLPPKLPHAGPPAEGAKLPLPWDDAKPAASLTGGPPPPPPPDATPPNKPAKKGEKTQGPVIARPGGSLLPELSAVVPASRLSGEESVLRERLAAKAAAMRKLDYFEILGLPTTANREDVKRSYFALAKEYHPDKHFGSSSAEVRQLAQQIYDLISTAHDTLADPIERERYVKDLASGVKREIGDEVGKILAAEGKFQRGEELMRQREYQGAWRHFQDAITLYGEEGEFHAWLGWARFQMDPKDDAVVQEAVTHIEKAITLNPRLDKAYLFLGYIHKASGRPDKAEKQFEKAIQSNPDCTEALRELRLLGKTKR